MFWFGPALGGKKKNDGEQEGLTPNRSRRFSFQIQQIYGEALSLCKLGEEENLFS
jgi:hypothetical protein